MANRPVFASVEGTPFYKTVNCEFEWFPGFSNAQKQRSLMALHKSFTNRYPDLKVLEISSKSMQEHGKDLSAFYLKKYVPELGESIPVECVFQSGKVFEHGGPFRGLMKVTPREAKRDDRLRTSGKLIGFKFDGKDFPKGPRTIFYDYIYINALLENEELAKELLKYDAFTDIEFNPEKSFNCQAKAAATFVSLTRMGLIEQVRDFDSFKKIYDTAVGSGTIKSKSTEMKKEGEQIAEGVSISVGSTVIHKKYGKGKVVDGNTESVTIDFETEGRKQLRTDWCVTNCEIR